MGGCSARRKKNCYQNGPHKARKEAKEGREGKESNHNRKEEGNREKKDRATNICTEDPPRQRKSQSLHSLA